MEIRYSKQSLKTLKTYDGTTRARILDGINGLTKTPPIGDIKQLRGSGGELRLRIGKHRVIYEYTRENEIKILLVNKIDTRGDVYK